VEHIYFIVRVVAACTIDITRIVCHLKESEVCRPSEVKASLAGDYDGSFL
jgi:hypothetical protein